MAKRVLLLHGHGFQFPGMAAKFLRSKPCSDIMSSIDSSLNIPVLPIKLSKYLQEDPGNLLSQGDIGMAATMATSILHWQYLKDMYGTSLKNFSFALGHSLGEFTACVIGGAISIEDGVRLAIIRGKATDEASKGFKTKMVAIMGNQYDVEEVIKENPVEGVCDIAGINHHKQIVLSGTQESVDHITEILKNNYKFVTKHINAHAAYHSRLMIPAAEKIRKELENIEIKDSSIPIVSNSRSEAFVKAEDIKESLIENIVKPTHFLAGAELTLNKKCTVFAELGPHPVLSNFILKIAKQMDLKKISVVGEEEPDE